MQITLDKDTPSQSTLNEADPNGGALLAYSHPKHKHRVMAFITKTVKRQPTDIATLVEISIQNFAGKGLNLVEANITKNITELEDKELVSIDNEVVSYIP